MSYQSLQYEIDDAIALDKMKQASSTEEMMRLMLEWIVETAEPSDSWRCSPTYAFIEKQFKK